MRTALLYSGGMDSACAFWALGRPECLHFASATDNEGPNRLAGEGEFDAVNEQVRISPEFRDKLTVIEHDFTPYRRKGVWKYARDAVMCHLAWARGYDRLLIAWVREDGVGPRGMAMQVARLEGAVHAPGFAVEYPVIRYSKRQLIELALDRGMPENFLLATHSCVRQRFGSCGQCNQCKHRLEAMATLQRRVSA